MRILSYFVVGYYYFIIKNELESRNVQVKITFDLELYMLPTQYPQ